jgi:hypothetical protein
MALWYLGIPVNTKSYMFRDNQAVVRNNQYRIHHQANEILHHFIIAFVKLFHAQILGYYWIDGKQTLLILRAKIGDTNRFEV